MRLRRTDEHRYWILFELLSRFSVPNKEIKGSRVASGQELGVGRVGVFALGHLSLCRSASEAFSVMN